MKISIHLSTQLLFERHDNIYLQCSINTEQQKGFSVFDLILSKCFLIGLFKFAIRPLQRNYISRLIIEQFIFILFIGSVQQNKNVFDFKFLSYKGSTCKMFRDTAASKETMEFWSEVESPSQNSTKSCHSKVHVLPEYII